MSERNCKCTYKYCVKFFFCTLKFTGILAKNIELMSWSSNEYEVFRSKNNTEIRHIVYYLIILSLRLSVHNYFLVLHPITLFVSGWPLFGR